MMKPNIVLVNNKRVEQRIPNRWDSDTFVDVYLAYKHSELEHVKDMDDLAHCAEYGQTY